MKHIIYAISLICLIQSEYTYSSSNQKTKLDNTIITFYGYELPEEAIHAIQKHREKFTAIEVKNQNNSSIIEAAKEAVEENRKKEANRLLTAQNTRQLISFSSKDSRIQAILSDSSKTQADKDAAIKELLRKEVADLRKAASQY